MLTTDIRMTREDMAAPRRGWLQVMATKRFYVYCRPMMNCTVFHLMRIRAVQTHIVPRMSSIAW